MKKTKQNKQIQCRVFELNSLDVGGSEEEVLIITKLTKKK